MNRVFTTLGLALLAIVQIPAASHADPPTTVTVTLVVDAPSTFPFAEPTQAVSCSVTVAVNSTAADVLDAGVANGCIASWATRTFSFGRFVTEINGTHGCNTFIAPLDPGLSWAGTLTAWSWWEFRINGASSLVGIDDYTVAGNDTIGFLYHSELSIVGPAPQPTPVGVVPCMFQ